MNNNKVSWLLIAIVAIVAILVALPACTGSTPLQKPPQANVPQTSQPYPTVFQVSSLAVNPPEIDAGIDAIVTARVTNTASSDGTYIGEVRVEDGKSLPDILYTGQVTIPAGDTKVVSVVVNQGRAGSYRVRWSGLTGDLVVKPVKLSEPGKSAGSGPTTNITAPDFNVTELISGQKISLSQYKGKVVLLSFVNYGCDPRLNNIVDKQFQIIKQVAGQRSDFVSISIFCGCCPPDVLRDFTRQNGFNWPWILDSDNSVVRKYISYVGKFGYPTLVLIDKDQVVREATGFKDAASLNASLDKILNK